MNWKVILILAALCLGLGVFLFLETGKESKVTEVERDYLLPYRPEAVVAMRITLFDTTFMIEKKDDGWIMREPHEGWLADSLTINHLLTTLSKVAPLGNISSDSVDLNLLMLDPPAISFTIFTPERDSVFLGFGVFNPSTENIYVRRGDRDRISLIGSVVGPMIAFNSFMIRGKGLMAFHPFDICNIKYSRIDGKELSAALSPDTRKWYAEGSKQLVPLDKRIINNMLFDLYSGVVREFRDAGDYTARQTGLNRPLRQLRFENQQGDTTLIALGGTLEGREYLRWAMSTLYPGELLLVDSLLMNRMDDFIEKDILDLRMTDFQTGEVERIELFSPLDSIVIVAENDTLWKITSPEKVGCRIWVVDKILTHADSMSASKLIPGKSRGRGFDRPQLELNLYSAEKTTVSLLFGDFAGGNQVYVLDRLNDRIFLSKTENINRLTYSFKDLADIPLSHRVQ